MSLHGQLDLFTGVTVDRPAAPPVARRVVKAPVEPGQVRYASFGGKRDCDDCWQAQAAADAAGAPVPLRRRATGSRETVAGRTLLCELHKLDRQSTDKGVEV